jgi:hypothetical protein
VIDTNLRSASNDHALVAGDDTVLFSSKNQRSFVFLEEFQNLILPTGAFAAASAIRLKIVARLAG